MRDPSDTSPGGWRPARPLPFYLAFGRCRCDCGKRFWSERRYNHHWDVEHQIEVVFNPDYPRSQGKAGA